MDIKEFINAVCHDLGIRKPLMRKDDSHFETPTQLAMLSVENGKKVLYLRKRYNDAVTAMFSVAHELRHAYQIDNGSFDFKSYQSSSDSDVRSYNLQEAEIDANAYAYLILYDNFGIEIKLNNLDEDVIRKIKARADAIRYE